MATLININSVGRCGSTFISRLINLIPGYRGGQVVGLAPSDLTIQVIRNRNDVIVSYWKTQMSEQGRYSEIETSRPSSKEINIITERIDRIQIKIDKTFSRSDIKLVYEKFYNDYDYIYDKLEAWLDITITKTERKIITKKIGRPATKKLQKKFENFSQMHSLEHIHGHHISNDNGKPGSWKKYLGENYK